jgi:hypothetical protein
MACTILQKQIEHIDGKKENITVPSVAMKRVREKEQAGNSSRSRTNADIYINDILEAQAREQVVSGSSSINSSYGNDVEMTASSTASYIMETSTQTSVTITGTIIDPMPTSTEVFVENHTDNAPNLDLCRLCLSKEWYPALLPCGHVRCNILHKYSFQ